MTVRRIVLGLEARASEPAILAATDLARAMELDLLGLFVEDVDLLHLAALPFASEVAFPSAVTRRLDPAAMERSLRAHSQQARAALARRLEGLPIRWDFGVVRGSALAAVLEAAAEGDLVVAPMAAGRHVPDVRKRDALLRAIRRLRQPLLLVKPGAAPRAPVTVVIGPDATLAEVAVDLGALTIPYGGTLSVFTVGTNTSESSEQEAAAIAMLSGLGAPPRVRFVTVADPARLLGYLADEQPGLLVRCGSGPPLDELIGLTGLGCSLLLLPGPRVAGPAPARDEPQSER